MKRNHWQGACALACACAGSLVAAAGDWTGGAGDDTKITTAANWTESTDLTGGTALMKVTGGTKATVPADGTDYAFKGVNVQTAGFTFDAEPGAKAVTLGAQGLTNAVAGATWAWPATLGAAQIWYAAAGASLDVREPVAGSAQWTFYGSGRVNWYATNTYAGTLRLGTDNGGDVSKVCVHVYPGAALAAAGGTVSVGSGSSSHGLWLHGVTVDHKLVVGTANTTTRMGFYSAVGETNVINGAFESQYANRAFWGLKGVTVFRGGAKFQTGSNNYQQRTNPLADPKAVIRVERKPLVTHLTEVTQGTVELAVENNVFGSLGLRLSGTASLKTEVPFAVRAQKTGQLATDNSIGLTAGTWDLGGGDQSLDYFCGLGGTVTSVSAAQLHIVSDTYQPNRANKNDAYANFGADMSVVKSVFAGGAGLSKEGAHDLYVAAANTSTGVLTVAKGRLVLSVANGGATYPGTAIAKTQGSWAGRIDVTDGTLAIEHASALGPRAALYVSGGTVELAEGVVLPAYRVYVTDGAGGWTQLRGTCGGAASGAANQPTFPGTSTPVFTGKGTVCVGASLPDGWPAAWTAAAWTEAGADRLVTTAANWNPSAANPYDGSLFARFAAGTAAKLPDNDYIFLQGLAFSQANFALEDGTGTTVFLGKAGLTNATTGVVWNWPASIGTFEPLWWLAPDSTMELRAPLAGTGELGIWGGGRLDVYSTNTLRGTVRVGNSNSQSADPVGEISVYIHPGATLAGAGGTVNCGCRAGWGLHLMGTTLDCDVTAGTQNVGSPGGLFVEPGTTNAINGLFTAQYANLSYLGVAGHLTLRGGAKFQTNSRNTMQRFRPVNAATGTLRIESKPVTSHLCEVAYGRFELAAPGNVFRRQGLWLNGGRIVIDADGTLAAQGKTAGDENNCAALSSGTFDLNGHDVQFDAVNARGATVTSATPAQFRVKDNVLHAYSSQINNYVKPYGTTGTVWKTAFAGAAGLRKEGSLDLYLASVNASTGTLTAAGGRLVLSASDSGATYPGTAIGKSCGAWRAGCVEVTNATLVVEHRNAFSKETTLAVLAGGRVELAAGVTAHVGALYIDGVRQADGVYGAATNPGVFAGTGLLRVGDVGLRVIVCQVARPRIWGTGM